MTTERKRRPGSRRRRRGSATSWAVLLPGIAMEYDPTFTPSLEQREKNQKDTGKDTA